MPSPTIFFNSVASEASGGVASSSDRSVGLKQPVGLRRQLFILVLLFTFVAKHKRKRSMKGYLKGNIDEGLALGALASRTLVGNVWDESPEQDTLISSIEVIWTLDNLRPPQGPILFGVAHSDYSDTEIEAVIENSGSWD